jgi:hypothetical protein
MLLMVVEEEVAVVGMTALLFLLGASINVDAVRFGGILFDKYGI